MTPEQQIAELEATILTLNTTNGELVSRVTQLESINVSLVDGKKELKKKLEEGSTDEVLKAELQNYKDQLATVEETAAEKATEYETKVNDLTMMQVLTGLGVEAQSGAAMDTIKALALKGATPKDGGFVYLNEDGTTIFNEANKEYGVNDRINELKESADNSYHFAEQKGGGFTGNTTKPPETKKSVNDIISAGLKY